MTQKEVIQGLESIESRAEYFPCMTDYDWVVIAAAKRHLKNRIDKKGTDSDNNPKSLWFDAQGEYLPEYDREVIVLIQDYPDDEEHLRVACGHRPNPDGYITKDGGKLYPMTYGKGGWNWKNIKWWLDVNFPIPQTILSNMERTGRGGVYYG